MTEKIKKEEDKYLVEFMGFYYPIRKAISLGNKYADGEEELDPLTATFEEAIVYLKKLGFEILKLEDKKAIWICYDFGMRGDYTGLYKWLDNNEAEECGDQMAVIKRTITDDIVATLTQEIKENIELKKDDRIYIIFQNNEGKTKGRFIFGNRKRASWEGYGENISEEVDEED